MFKRALFFALLLLLLAALAGCAYKQEESALEQTMLGYSKAIRWNEFQVADSFLDPEASDDETLRRINFERWQHLRVTGYNELSSSPGPGEDEYTQWVEIRFVNRHTAVERVIRDQQVWRWDEAGERWLLTTGLPDPTQRR